MTTSSKNKAEVPAGSGGNETGKVASAGKGRWFIYIVIFLAAMMQLVRIYQVRSKNGDVPFHSANDRSRWCTIESLATTGGYEIDYLLFTDETQGKRTPWASIDMVRHRGRDGKLHYYSSKPPLLPTLYAGVYWCFKKVTGMDLIRDTFDVARIMLVLVNWIPLLMFWIFWLRSFAGDGQSSWSALVLSILLGFGTFLSTFASTLNNHLPAAIAVGISVWCLNKILVTGDARLRWFALAGLCTSFGAANELPALSWVAAAGAMLLVVAPLKFVLGYLPALLPVLISFFGFNYLAHDELSPAYAHRDVGKELFSVDIQAGTNHLSTGSLIRMTRANGIECSANCSVREARRPRTYELLDNENQRQFALRLSEDETKLTAYEWGDWYDYPKSYWLPGKKQGVDKGEPDRGTYIFHCLIGHHGIFSLTPFWLISLFGLACVFRERSSINFFRDHRWMLCLAIFVTSVVVIGFYLSRSLEDRNYGGVTSGFRWTFWMIPLWLWLAQAALANFESAFWRRFTELLVLLSIFSASYPWANPWTTPWPMQLAEYWGWIRPS